ALGSGSVKGVVYDSPILRYFVAQNPTMGFSLVGEPFDLQDYGYALQLGSPLRKEVNAALLKLQVAGWTDELEDKWFQTPPTE
ncbi:MAG: ABC transporter substrate-binding protein, partial [Chthoniobacterales bacterium]